MIWQKVLIKIHKLKYAPKTTNIILTGVRASKMPANMTSIPGTLISHGNGRERMTSKANQINNGKRIEQPTSRRQSFSPAIRIVTKAIIMPVTRKPMCCIANTADPRPIAAITVTPR